MSYVVSIKKTISPEEFSAVVENDPAFEAGRYGEGYRIVHWTQGDEHADFVYTRGEIEVKTPSDGAWKKMEAVAAKLGAQLIGEEDYPAPPTGNDVSLAAARSVWLGWPLLVIVLLALLVWRW